MATGFQAATLAWLVEHEPAAMIAQTASVLLPGDYLRYRLTGELATEPSDASSTLLFDIRQRAWSSRGCWRDRNRPERASEHRSNRPTSRAS